MNKHNGLLSQRSIIRSIFYVPGESKYEDRITDNIKYFKENKFEFSFDIHKDILIFILDNFDRGSFVSSDQLDLNLTDGDITTELVNIYKVKPLSKSEFECQVKLEIDESNKVKFISLIKNCSSILDGDFNKLPPSYKPHMEPTIDCAWNYLTSSISSIRFKSKQVILNYDNYESNLSKLLNSRRNIYKSGYDFIDNNCGGGIHEHCLTIIAGRTGGFKTTLALNFMLNQSLLGYKVLYVSLEMDQDFIQSKLLSIMSSKLGCDLNFISIITNNIKTDEGKKDLKKVSESLKEAFKNITIINPNKRISPSGLELLISKEKYDVVYVDHVGLLTSDGKSKESYAREAEKLMDLRTISLNNKISLICLSQINREGSKSGKVPKLEHLALSSEIEKSARLVLMSYTDESKNNALSLYILKNDMGAKNVFNDFKVNLNTGLLQENIVDSGLNLDDKFIQDLI